MATHQKIRWLGRMTTPALTLALAAGFLIWMKLRLVTGLPRSVYAEPIVMPTIPTDVNQNIPTMSVDTADKAWRTLPSDLTATDPTPHFEEPLAPQ